MISMVAQPMFWAMLSNVGSTEPRRPNMPRRETMAGAPVVAPNIADPPSSRAPIAQPTTTAAMASPTEPVVSGDQRPGERAEQADAEVGPHGQLVDEPQRSRRIGREVERGLRRPGPVRSDLP